jgi:hypothetical protein
MNINQLFRTFAKEMRPVAAGQLELKVGQIVRGVVLKPLEGQDALVNIGGKVVRAQLEAPLKQGEATMLQVQPESTQGQIVLKPLQASVVPIADESLASLLEGMDLQDRPEIRQLVQQMHQTGIPLTKENIEQLAAMMMEATGADAEQWNQAAVIAFQRKLPLTMEVAGALRQALQSESLAQRLSQLSEMLSSAVQSASSANQAPAPALLSAQAAIRTVNEMAAQIIPVAVATPGMEPPDGMRSGGEAGGARASSALAGGQAADGEAAARQPGATAAGAAAGLPQAVSGGAGSAAGNGAMAAGSYSAGALGQQAAPGVAGSGVPLSAAAASAAPETAAGASQQTAAAAASPTSTTSPQVAAPGVPAPAQAAATAAAGQLGSAANSAAPAPPPPTAAVLQSAQAAATAAAGQLGSAANGAAPATPPATPTAAVLQPARATATAAAGQLGIAADGTASASVPATVSPPPTAAGSPPSAVPNTSAQPPATPAGEAAAPAATNSGAFAAGDPAPAAGNIVSRLLHALGFSHENFASRLPASNDMPSGVFNLAQPLNATSDDAALSLKHALLQLASANDIPASIKDSAQQIVQQLNGQQLLLSADRAAVFSQVTMFIPFADSKGNHTASVHIQARKGKRGEIDADNCRLLFDLDMQAIGNTMVDVQIVDRIVSFQVMNDHPLTAAVLESEREEIGDALKRIGYKFISMKISPYPDRAAAQPNETGPAAAFSTQPGFDPRSFYKARPYKGVDVRV